MSCYCGVEKFYQKEKRLVIEGWLNNLLDEEVVDITKIVVPFNKNMTKYISEDPSKGLARLRVGSKTISPSVYYLVTTSGGGSYIQFHFDRSNPPFDKIGSRYSESFSISIGIRTDSVPSDLKIVPNMTHESTLEFVGECLSFGEVAFMSDTSKEEYVLETQDTPPPYQPLKRSRKNGVEKHETVERNGDYAALGYVLLVAIIILIFYFFLSTR